MRDVAVIGVGMTHFGKFLEKSNKDLVREAVNEATADARIDKKDIEAAYMGNAAAGLLTGQEMVRGQVALTSMGIDEIPIYNVENACASSSSAFNLGWMAVAAGVHDCVLVTGFEKLYHKDKRISFQTIGSAVDLDNYITYFKKVEENSGSEDKIIQEGGGDKRSMFMDMYSFLAKFYMKKYGLTQKHYAMLSVKSHKNGALNPHAQYQDEVTLEEVLRSGDVSYPLTRMMCAPLGDGGTAAILCAKSKVARFGAKPVWIEASMVGSGTTACKVEECVTKRLATKLYDAAGIGPTDIDVVEVHDATSPSEIMYLIELGICSGEDAPKWIEEGYLELNGRMPTNSSGGLVAKGHPLGATGCGQIYEIVKQLRGEAGKRQVKDAKVGMTQNGGGIIGIDAAAVAMHIFKR